MATYYVTQSGAGAANGTSLANAWSVANYNASSTPGAGDTVNFSGNITSQVVVGTSGSVGNPLILNGSTHSATLSYNAASPRLSLSTRNYVTVDGFAFAGDDRHCVGGANNTHTGITVKNCTYTGPTDGGASLVADGKYIDLLIEGNTCDNCIVIWSDTSTNTNWTIRNNYFRTPPLNVTDQVDLISWGDASNVTIEGNKLIHRTPGGGGARHNDLIQCYRSGATPNANPTNLIIRYNWIERAESDGSGGNMSWCQLENLSGTPACQIYSNVFVGGSASWAGGNGIIFDATVNSNDTFYFHNNTVITHASPINVLRFGTTGSHNGILYARNNACYNDSTKTLDFLFTEGDDWNPNFFGNYSDATSTEAGANGSTSLTSGAFTDETNNDFTTPGASVLRNAGYSSLSATYNQGIAFGATWPNPSLVTRTVGNWDVGAFQFVETTTNNLEYSGVLTVTSLTIG